MRVYHDEEPISLVFSNTKENTQQKQHIMSMP